MPITAMVSSNNPSFSPDPTAVQDDHHELPSSRRRNMLTVAGIAFVATVAFVAGTVVGGIPASASDANTPNNPATTVSDMDVIASIVAAKPSLSTLTTTTANELVSLCDDAPEAWNNAFIPEAYIQAASNLRKEEFSPDEGTHETRRHLLRGHQHGERGRDLIGSLSASEGTLRAAWEAAFGPKSQPRINHENDSGGVVLDADNRCRIEFDKSDSVLDWWDNLNMGNDPLLSVMEYSEAHASCPTSTCIGRRELGQGYAGFLVAWNNLSLQVWERIVADCDGADEYVFTGFSRGGAVAAQAAAGLYLEGLLPAFKIKLVTFATPRVLSEEMSDRVHNKFEQVRFVVGGDPVPSLPPNTFDLKHFGDLRCLKCGYAEERDRPYWPNPIFAFQHRSKNYQSKFDWLAQ